MTTKIEELIVTTLKELFELPEIKNEKLAPPQKNGLVFPKYSNKESKSEGETRFSEQECRFLFTKNIDKEFLYSVETPTKFAYRFSESKDKHTKEKLRGIKYPVKLDENLSKLGQSAQIDLCIHNEKGDIEYAIEFKSHNVDTVAKDLLKLSVEGKERNINFFIHTFEKFDDNTLKSVIEKYNKAFKHISPNRIVIFMGTRDGYYKIEGAKIKIKTVEEENVKQIDVEQIRNERKKYPK